MIDYKREYLGDGVHAIYDGYHIWLSVDDSNGLRQIALEPAVLRALDLYRKRVCIGQEAEEKQAQKGITR